MSTENNECCGPGRKLPYDAVVVLHDEAENRLGMVKASKTNCRSEPMFPDDGRHQLRAIGSVKSPSCLGCIAYSRTGERSFVEPLEPTRRSVIGTPILGFSS